MGEQGHAGNGRHTLHFKWEWSFNTIAIVFGLLAGAVGWGYMLSEVRGSLDSHNLSIAEIRSDVKRIEEVNERLANHEMRIANVENLAESAATAARLLEQAINTLGSDVRLTREILQRLERRQGRQPQTNDSGN